MKKLAWNQLFIGLLVEVGSISFYRFIQKSAPGKYDFMTQLDVAIPFIPEWIWIYVSILPIFLYAALTLQKELFHSTLKRVVVAHFLSYPFFFLLPSNYPRPSIEHLSAFYNWGYGVMHTIDNVNNTFPSLHVSITWVICHMLKRNGMRGWMAYGYAVIISASTLFTKQHYVVDVLGGVLIFLVTLTLINFKQKTIHET
ncbi:phosphatase PAP2 family protein [Candidatus Falkowbacteria bacterium]|nr:phosphatase PAP2 family protein [Candidatus Falkowbacteria bacterium]